MSEDLISHIVFDLRTHHMTIIPDKIVTVSFYDHQQHHKNPQPDDGRGCFLNGKHHNSSRNIPHHQRNHKGNGCSDHCKHHIRQEQPLIRFVIRRQFFLFVLHIFPPKVSAILFHSIPFSIVVPSGKCNVESCTLFLLFRNFQKTTSDTQNKPDKLSASQYPPA